MMPIALATLVWFVLGGLCAGAACALLWCADRMRASREALERAQAAQRAAEVIASEWRARAHLALMAQRFLRNAEENFGDLGTNAQWYAPLLAAGTACALFRDPDDLAMVLEAFGSPGRGQGAPQQVAQVWRAIRSELVAYRAATDATLWAVTTDSAEKPRYWDRDAQRNHAMKLLQQADSVALQHADRILRGESRTSAS